MRNAYKEQRRLLLSLLNHLMTFSGNPHSKGFWVGGVGWVCACGLAIEWSGKEFVPKEKTPRY